MCSFSSRSVLSHPTAASLMWPFKFDLIEISLECLRHAISASGASQPRVAGGCHIGRHRYRTFPPSQEVPDGAHLDQSLPEWQEARWSSVWPSLCLVKFCSDRDWTSRDRFCRVMTTAPLSLAMMQRKKSPCGLRALNTLWFCLLAETEEDPGSTPSTGSRLYLSELRCFLSLQVL